jgi:hypothetical protein
VVVVGVGVTTTNPVPTLAKMRIVSIADETIIVAVAVFVRHEWILFGIIFGWEGAGLLCKLSIRKFSRLSVIVYYSS